MNADLRPANHVLVLFGATGDLAKRKILPGLFHLWMAGLMPERFHVIGSSPAQWALTDEEFRVEGDLICIGPIHEEDALSAVIAALEELGLVYFDDFVDLSGNWPAWLTLFAMATRTPSAS